MGDKIFINNNNYSIIINNPINNIEIHHFWFKKIF